MFPVQCKQVGELSAVQKNEQETSKVAVEIEERLFHAGFTILHEHSTKDICCKRWKYISLSANSGLSRPEHNAATGHYALIEQSCSFLLSLYSLIV